MTTTVMATVTIAGNPVLIPHEGITIRLVPNADGLHLIMHDQYGIQINSSVARTLDEALRAGLYGHR